MRLPIVVIAALAGMLLSCDAFTGLFEPQWEPAETNGNDGVYHFVMNPFDLRIGYPEHVRVERIETRTTKKPGGAAQVQKRERKARCESKSICDAIPHSDDTREIVITPKIFGETTLYVTAVIDEQEELKDSIKVRVQ